MMMPQGFIVQKREFEQLRDQLEELKKRMAELETKLAEPEKRKYRREVQNGQWTA
jgi:phage shock protein A